MALKLKTGDISSEPPRTSTEEEPDTPKTVKKKLQKLRRKERYHKQKQQKLKLKQEVDEDIALLKTKHQGPWPHIWDQYPSLKIDSNGKFMLYNVQYGQDILGAYLMYEHLGDRKYKTKYYYHAEYMEAIGQPKKKSFYGSASMAKPKHSKNFDEENEVLKQEMSKDMITNICRYNIAKKKGKTIKPYTYTTPSAKYVYGPGRFKHEYYKMEENYIPTEPITDSDSDEEQYESD